MSIFWKGFALQFVNVKIYLFGITALTGFITDYSRAFPVLFLFEMIIATVGTIATATWIGLGMMIQTFYEKHFRIINIIMGADAFRMYLQYAGQLVSGITSYLRNRQNKSILPFFL